MELSGRALNRVKKELSKFTEDSDSFQNGMRIGKTIWPHMILLKYDFISYSLLYKQRK